MIEQILDMPTGALGFRASGDVTREEYAEVLVPPLMEALEGGAKVRLLFQIGPEFEEFEPGAMWEDAKFGVRLGIPHFSAWERTAIVSDVPWVHRAIKFMGWMQPGDLRVFPLDKFDDAKAWLVG